MKNANQILVITLLLFLSTWGVQRATHHHWVHWSEAEEPSLQQQQQQYEPTLPRHGGQIFQDKDNVYEVVGDMKDGRVYVYVPSRPANAIPTVLAGVLPKTMVVKILRNGSLLGTSNLSLIQDPPPEAPSYWGTLPTTVNTTEGLNYEIEF